MIEKDKNKRVKTLVFISILVSGAVIFSFIDKYISSIAFPHIPGGRIGLANIVIMIAVMNLNIKESIVVVILKSIIVGLIFTSIINFIIGFSASMVSFFTIVAADKIKKSLISYIGISILGSVTHSITQIVVVSIIYKLGSEMIIYGTQIYLLSIITGAFIGLIAIGINKKIKPSFLKES